MAAPNYRPPTQRTLRGVGAWLAATGDALASVLFPADCRLCENLLTRASRIPICDDCLDSFLLLKPPICEKCGQPLQIPSFAERANSAARAIAAASATAETSRIARVPAEISPGTSGICDPSAVSALICRACQANAYRFDVARSYASYQGALIRAIVLLKFERMDSLGTWFALHLAEIVRREPHLCAADLVVPVPLHRQRERERGYNQADLIGRPLAKRLKLRYQDALLVRTKPRPDKHILSREERWQSVRGAFATRQGVQVDNLRVLLVDDVMTTGATLDACAKALREAGAKSVIGLTVARAVRHPVVGLPESNPENA